MKRSCKRINITDVNTILPWVKICIEKHAKRHDFRKMLLHIGKMPREDYDAAISTHDYTLYDAPARNIAAEAARRTAARDLRLRPVRYRERIDKSSGKLRLIGDEEAMQQIFDYIAVYATQEIWKRRIVKQQASSLPGRGASYGVPMIRRWIQRDNRAAGYAKKHNKKYTRKCKYFVKLDVKKCYPSLRKDVFIHYFERDCANTDLLWLWDMLLSSHTVRDYHGFMIGALSSQYACQYLLSFAWRYVNDLNKTRRGKHTKLVNHSLFYMDDMLLLSGSRRDLKSAVRKLVKHVQTNLRLTIKTNWCIQDIDEHPIDMMGYRIYTNGKSTIRPRVFIRARRGALRFGRKQILNLRQARRANSYKGYFTSTNSYKIIKKLHFPQLWKASAKIESMNARRKSDGKNGNQQRTICGGTAGDPVYAVA
nr:MAG TPA_asm: Maturase reverse transcriptase/DNA/RNA Complex II intron, retroelement, retrotransposition [Caudoviricetes sp.]